MRENGMRHPASLSKTFLKAILFGTTAVVLAQTPARAQQILFWSTQATPVEETKKMREQVLAGFGKPVTYLAQDPGPYSTRIEAELKAGKGTITLLGGLHGEFAAYVGDFLDLSDVVAKASGVSEAFVKLGKFGGTQQKYVPWMQASYIMAANKQALQYLPAGADINKLTYAQLAEWGKKMREATGSPKLGFPAGPKGLMHRFFQGYLYPSYTGSAVTKFRSPEAEKMWEDFKTLWAEVDPCIGQLRLHAGASPHRRSVGCLGPYRAARGRIQSKAQRFRGFPRARRSSRAGLHARRRRSCDSENVSERR